MSFFSRRWLIFVWLSVIILRPPRCLVFLLSFARFRRSCWLVLLISGRCCCFSPQDAPFFCSLFSLLFRCTHFFFSLVFACFCYFVLFGIHSSIIVVPPEKARLTEQKRYTLVASLFPKSEGARRLSRCLCWYRFPVVSGAGFALPAKATQGMD